jgi:hypothetical protein
MRKDFFQKNNKRIFLCLVVFLAVLLAFGVGLLLGKNGQNSELKIFENNQLVN